MNTFRKTIDFGKIAMYGTRKINRVTLDVELRLKEKSNSHTIDGDLIERYVEFAVSGAVWNGNGSDWITGGQCLDNIPAGRLNNVKRFVAIRALWEQWHLNTMRAGTREQSEVISTARAQSIEAFQDAGYKLDASGIYGRDEANRGYFFYVWEGYAGSYEFNQDALKAAGLLSAPFGKLVPSANGNLVQPEHLYGSAWLVEPLTTDAIRKILKVVPDTEEEREEIRALFGAEITF